MKDGDKFIDDVRRDKTRRLIEVSNPYEWSMTYFRLVEFLKTLDNTAVSAGACEYGFRK